METVSQASRNLQLRLGALTTYCCDRLQAQAASRSGSLRELVSIAANFRVYLFHSVLFPVTDFYTESATCSCRSKHPLAAQFADLQFVFGDRPSSYSVIHYLQCTSEARASPPTSKSPVFGVLAPISIMLPLASSDQLRALARAHSIVIPRGVTRREQFLTLLTSHSCESSCSTTVAWFSSSTPAN